MVELGIYKHYKGGLYKVIANGLIESTQHPAVIYEAMYDNPKSKIWIREEADFLATVEVDGQRVARFTKQD
ncbi:DUF1653 domain-containing protein [bacterium]|nr:MAG: DUF1653 domain-containing protein [bacterium]